jgi:hypothetical protein
VPTQLEALIDETESGTSSMTLKQIRELAVVTKGGHNHAWYENSGVPADKFFVGDVGYIPPGKDFCFFVLLGNIIKDGKVAFSSSHRWHGDNWCWDYLPVRREPLQAFELPEAVAA